MHGSPYRLESADGLLEGHCSHHVLVPALEFRTAQLPDKHAKPSSALPLLSYLEYFPAACRIAENKNLKPETQRSWHVMYCCTHTTMYPQPCPVFTCSTFFRREPDE